MGRVKYLLVLALAVVGASCVPAAPTLSACGPAPEVRYINDPNIEWGGHYSRWGSQRPTIEINVAPDHNAHGLDWTLRHEMGHWQADMLGLANTEAYADAVADGSIARVC